MMTREQWREAIIETPVFDTHTHMNNVGVPIAAQNVWDIVHYFWFQQELWSLGYPHDPMELPEDERIERFVSCFGRARNTAWALMIRETFRDLYGIELHDAASVREADEAVRATSVDPAWPRHVIERLNIKRITVNHDKLVDFPGLHGVGAGVPLWEGYKEWTKRILEADDQHEAGEVAAAVIREDVARFAAKGYRGMRVQPQAFDGRPKAEIVEAVARGAGLPKSGATNRDVAGHIAHCLFDALSEHGMFAQLFLGIGKVAGARHGMAVDDPSRIVNLYPLFERYDCDFELVAGAPGSNMDIAQAARIYPNVYAGGLWWYNYRSSTYRHAMQTRLEAVPAGKSVILASDARHIEWCYTKTLLVKRLLADFLHDQVAHDWISESDALWVANEWLHDAVERRYTPSGSAELVPAAELATS